MHARAMRVEPDSGLPIPEPEPLSPEQEFGLLRQRFHERLQREEVHLRQLTAAMGCSGADADAAGDIERFAHRLRGAALVFGFVRIGDAAKAVELAAAAMAPKGDTMDPRSIAVTLEELAITIAAETGSAPPSAVVRNKRVLLVDDDPDVSQAMHIRLKANSYETCFASDAPGSVVEATRQRPDLIILDLGLPDGDGYVVIATLKKTPALADIPIIVVSAREARGNEDRAISAGAKVYLQKPVDNAELLAVIRQTLSEPEQSGDACVTGRGKLTAG